MTPSNIDAIVLFSGPGGVSTGLRQAGITRSLGIEFEENACNTARAAGHSVLEADVASLDPWLTAFNFDLISAHRELLLQASPPCQGLSKAGKGKGRDDLVYLLDMIELLRAGEVMREDAHTLIQRLTDLCSDPRSPLTFEVVRWIAELDPHHVVLEQVPAALPIWEAIAELLKMWGYSVWCGNVQAEQYGVPQTRKRAILIASRTIEVSAPVPTHSQYHTRTPGRLDENVLPWVSMADALEWGVDDLVGFPRKADGRGEVIVMDGEDYRARDLREAAKPAFVVTEKARSWDRFPTHMGDVYNSKGCIRSVNEPGVTMTSSMDNGNFQFIDEEHPPAKTVDHLAARRAAVEAEVLPRVNNQSGTEFDLAWPVDRPSPVVAGREIITMPGANANRFNGSTKSRNDGIRVLDWEAGVLQSFPKIDMMEVDEMTRDEFCKAILAAGHARVDVETGLVYTNRGPGGRVTGEWRESGTEGGKGYLVGSYKVGPHRKQVRLNRLVWIAAYGDIPEGKVVDHVNNIKSDNRIDNLQLLTSEENSAKAFEDDLFADSPTRKIPESEYETIALSAIVEGKTHAALAEQYGVSRGRISQIVRASDYPWSGNKTVRFQQIGNAVPPQLMSALVAPLCVSESPIIRKQVTA